MSIKKTRLAPFLTTFDIGSDAITWDTKIPVTQAVMLGYNPFTGGVSYLKLDNNYKLITTSAGNAGIIKTSGTETTNSDIQPAAISGRAMDVLCNVTAIAGTSPTLDITLNVQDQSSSNWFTVNNFPQITATGQYRLRIDPMTASNYKFAWILGGTTPSFTFSLGFTAK